MKCSGKRVGRGTVLSILLLLSLRSRAAVPLQQRDAYNVGFWLTIFFYPFPPRKMLHNRANWLQSWYILFVYIYMHRYIYVKLILIEVLLQLATQTSRTLIQWLDEKCNELQSCSLLWILLPFILYWATLPKTSFDDGTIFWVCKLMVVTIWAQVSFWSTDDSSWLSLPIIWCAAVLPTHSFPGSALFALPQEFTRCFPLFPALWVL